MDRADVVVIGAGMAGLRCAADLASLGLQSIVLEARQRVGGRVQTLRRDRVEVIELGAQVIHGDRACTWDIVRAGGLRTAPLPPAPQLLFGLDGRLLTTHQLQAAGAVPPWVVADAITRRPVSRSVHDVLSGWKLDRASQAIAREWLTQVWGADPADLSAAGISAVKHAWGAGQGEFVVLDGYDRVAAYLARGLDIRLGSVIRRVRWGTGWAVAEADADAWRAQALVVTVPPSVVAAGGLRFDPPLPSRKLKAAQAIRMADALGIIGQLPAAADESRSVLTLGQAAGFWRTTAGSRMITGWLKGPSAARARARGPNASTVAAPVGDVLPGVDANAIRAIHVADWGADPFALGAFSYPRMGHLGAPATWGRSLAQTLFFAGEGTCGERHPGMVHGALESGGRAAAEVAASLGGTYPNISPADVGWS